MKDLEELKLAFLLKGDQERQKAKNKFLRECGHKIVEETPTAVAAATEASENEESKQAGINEKLKIVDKILREKRL